MPMIIEYLDVIACRKRRDVLFIDFDGLFSSYERRLIYRKTIAWLDKNNIDWQHCGCRDSMGDVGWIYLDIPYEEGNKGYQKVRDYLENPDGSMRYKRVTFRCLPLDIAVEISKRYESADTI